MVVSKILIDISKYTMATLNTWNSIPCHCYP